MLLQNHLSNYRIVLASNSPRRKELLGGLDIPFTVATLPDVDESYPSHLTAEEIPLYISRKKSEVYRPFMTNDTLLITADTIVWLDGKVFGKPKNIDDARHMLQVLSGKTHCVITGVTLATKEKEESFTSLSDVTFSQLNDSEIDYYLNHCQPYDKAGAYGIQEWIGYIGIERIKGSYFNVMGLPIQRLYHELKRFTYFAQTTL